MNRRVQSHLLFQVFFKCRMLSLSCQKSLNFFRPIFFFSWWVWRIRKGLFSRYVITDGVRIYILAGISTYWACQMDSSIDAILFCLGCRFQLGLLWWTLMETKTLKEQGTTAELAYSRLQGNRDFSLPRESIKGFHFLLSSMYWLVYIMTRLSWFDTYDKDRAILCRFALMTVFIPRDVDCINFCIGEPGGANRRKKRFASKRINTLQTSTIPFWHLSHQKRNQ